MTKKLKSNIDERYKVDLDLEDNSVDIQVFKTKGELDLIRVLAFRYNLGTDSKISSVVVSKNAVEDWVTLKLQADVIIDKKSIQNTINRVMKATNSPTATTETEVKND